MNIHQMQAQLMPQRRRDLCPENQNLAYQTWSRLARPTPAIQRQNCRKYTHSDIRQRLTSISLHLCLAMWTYKLCVHSLVNGDRCCYALVMCVSSLIVGHKMFIYMSHWFIHDESMLSLMLAFVKVSCSELNSSLIILFVFVFTIPLEAVECINVWPWSVSLYTCMCAVLDLISRPLERSG